MTQLFRRGSPTTLPLAGCTAINVKFAAAPHLARPARAPSRAGARPRRRCESPRGSVAADAGVAGEELFSVQCGERVEMMAGDRCAPYVWRRVRPLGSLPWQALGGEWVEGSCPL